MIDSVLIDDACACVGTLIDPTIRIITSHATDTAGSSTI
ncbi:hypothetical protein GGR61_000460 [Xanthomonas arboricola]|nr:hypothetical protein [Xanthomonas sp. 3058]